MDPQLCTLLRRDFVLLNTHFKIWWTLGQLSWHLAQNTVLIDGSLFN